MKLFRFLFFANVKYYIVYTVDRTRWKVSYTQLSIKWSNRRENVMRVNRFCMLGAGCYILISIPSLNACRLGFVLRTSTLKDWIMSTLWLDAVRCFAIEEVGDFVSVYEVQENCVIDSDSHFCVLWPSQAAIHLADKVRNYNQETARRLAYWLSGVDATVLLGTCLMADLRVLLVKLNKWSSSNGKALRTSSSSTVTGFSYGFLCRWQCSMKFSG